MPEPIDNSPEHELNGSGVGEPLGGPDQDARADLPQNSSTDTANSEQGPFDPTSRGDESGEVF
jgi:hypothetical protein